MAKKIISWILAGALVVTAVAFDISNAKKQNIEYLKFMQTMTNNTETQTVK